ncbi:MAG: ATP-grasp domain-containing protein [Oscillospiraceae bacterium]|nr:ATP-grasp domain-containing protein [Oscillospiraceae bacterium]
MNILILSAGTRNKVVQYFRRAFGPCGGRVIATDAQAIAPALYEADAWYVVPRISDPSYLDVILDICKKEHITATLSLIDPELSLLAENAERFEEAGVTIIGSGYELCERALDKMEMYRWLSSHGYRCARSWDDLSDFRRALAAGEVSFPVFVKPVRGSASIAISKVADMETVELLFAHTPGLMVQELLNGQEYGADCYIDLISGETVSIFTKKKLLMRAGETDKAVSVQDPALFGLLDRFIQESGWRGQIDIDIFRVGGEYVISEVNPRFGGGYPHAYECGCDHMSLILRNLLGEANPRRIGEYETGVVMMKYNEVMIRKEADL